MFWSQVNNAGCMVNQRETNDDNLEKNFATNTLGTSYMLMVSPHCGYDLGTYILSTELIPALEKSKCRPRIVRVPLHVHSIHCIILKLLSL